MEQSNSIERSEIWKQIHGIVKQIPRTHTVDDAPDAPSVATELEELFLKLLSIKRVSGCFLPTKSQLEQVIEEDYKQQYGTNYDEGSLENAKQGGLIITNWILNNR